MATQFKQRFPDYEESWGGYRMELDDMPARVLIDLSAEDFEGQEQLPISVCLSIPVRRYDDEGETAEGEQARSLLFELFERLEEQYLALLVGIVTFEDKFDVQFYLEAREGVEQELEALVAEHFAPHHLPYELSYEMDVEWNSYYSFSPDDWAVMQMENALVFENMEEAGDAMTAQRPVLFFALFGSEQGAKACMSELEQEGYRLHHIEYVEDNEDEEDEDFSPYWGLQFTKTMSLDSLDAFNDEYLRLAEVVSDHSGDLDGWEAEFIKA